MLLCLRNDIVIFEQLIAFVIYLLTYYLLAYLLPHTFVIISY